MARLSVSWGVAGMGEDSGREFVDAGLVTEAQLAEAVTAQQEIGGSISRILVKLRLLKDADLLGYVAKREGLEVTKSEDVVVDAEIMAKLPRDLVEKHEIVPLSHTATDLKLGLPNASDFPVVEEVRFLTGLEVMITLISSRDALKAIGGYYSGGEAPAPRHRLKRDAHAIAREVGGMGSVAGTTRSIADIDTSPAKLIKALAALLVEKRLITADELKDRVRRLEQ
jgi:hypothetical protein